MIGQFRLEMACLRGGGIIFRGLTSDTMEEADSGGKCTHDERGHMQQWLCSSSVLYKFMISSS